MKNTIIFNKSQKSRLYWFNIGKGAKLNLLNAEMPLLSFAWQLYLEDNMAISGDVEKLERLISR